MAAEGGCPAWRTREGDLVLMRDMSDAHVANAIAYLRRRHEAAVSASIGLAEDDAGGLMESGPESMTGSYVRLLEEAFRRGLKEETMRSLVTTRREELARDIRETAESIREIREAGDGRSAMTSILLTRKADRLSVLESDARREGMDVEKLRAGKCP